MEEQPRNGGGRVVSFEEAMMIGRHRNGSRSVIVRDVGAGHVARSSQPQGAVSRRRTYADGELDVFSAERYFKGAMDGDRRKEDGVAAVAPPWETPRASARPAVAVARPVGTRASAAASVSATSTATSANSRTTLLRRRRDHHRERKCCVPVGALVRSCSGKRSVRVDSGVTREVIPAGAGESNAAASKIDWYKELRMQKAAHGIVAGDHGDVVAATTALPPNLNFVSTAKVAAIGRDQVIREDKPAEFLTSSSSRRRSFTLVAPVRASVLANGRLSGDVGGNGNEQNEDDDDDGVRSESSSDLFEIKSLMIDDCPYEPSEASIQWSVATAPADAASERGDRVSARWMTAATGGHRSRDGGRGPVVAGRQSRDRSAALPSGCVSHRAVEVSAAPTAVPNEPRRRG